VDAHELFLRARVAWGQRGHSILRAVTLLDRALALDPSYAPAWQTLAAVQYSGAAGAHLPSMEASLRLAEAAARAFALAPRDGASWMVEGMRLEWIEKRPRKAAEAYQEAIKRAPHDTTAYGWLALLQASQGRFEDAIASARRGHAVDLNHPPAAGALGLSFFFARRFAEALAVFEPSPDFAIAWIFRAWIYELTGRLDEALQAIEEAVMSNETRFARRDRARILARMGRLTEAQEALDAVLESGLLFPSFERALYELAKGNIERARTAIDVATAERNPWVRLRNVDPRLDPLRDGARRPRRRKSARASPPRAAPPSRRSR
jgi:tetratricopeptide (TPR) repeat protein